MRAWLHERNVDLEERDFFQRPFTEAELRALLTALPEPEVYPEQSRREGRAALLFSWKSPSFKPALSKVEGALGLSPDSLDSEAIIRLMLREPRLIRRPIVRIGDTSDFVESLDGHRTSDLIIGADLKALEQALR